MVVQQNTSGRLPGIILDKQIPQHLTDWLPELADVITVSAESFTLPDSEIRPLVAVIMAGATASTLIGRIQQTAPDIHILLVIPADALIGVPDDLLDHADSLAFANPAFIEKQVRSCLKMIASIQTSEAHIKYLEGEIKAQKRAIDDIELLKNAIVRNVSHELRTPLLQVKSAVSMLAEDLKESKLIAYAENATARLETHVKNITMLGQSLDIKITPVILRDTIEYARRNLSRVWERRSEIDRIQVSLEHNLPPVLADKQGMSTVLQLLMDNALKFSEGAVEVRAVRTGSRVRLTIQDYGIGIPQDKIGSIFDVFYQVDPSSTRRYGGAGVGLTIVKLILDRHNSTIKVDSAPGKGSIFSFEIAALDLSSDTSNLRRNDP